MDVDPKSGVLNVTGYSNSGNYPVLGTGSTGPKSKLDAFLTQMTSSGSDILFSTMFGGSVMIR